MQTTISIVNLLNLLITYNTMLIRLRALSH